MVINGINSSTQHYFAKVKDHGNNVMEGKIYNPSNPAYPILRETAKNDEGKDSLYSSIKSFFLFDLALKGIGIFYNKVKGRDIKYLDRILTPNKIGLEIGKNLNNFFTTPIKELSKVAGEVTKESIKAGSGFFGNTIKPLLKFSGAPFMMGLELVIGIGDVIKAFKENTLTGIKQLGKSVTKAVINTASFIGGEVIGASIGSFMGSRFGETGRKAGAWIGGMIGGATASFYSNKVSGKLEYKPSEVQKA